MAALTVQNISDTGAAPNFALNTVSASDTAEVGNGSNTFAVYKNSSGSPVNVTIVVDGNTSYGEELPDKVVAVPATGEAWIPLRKAYSGDGGVATITTAGAASLTVAVVKLS